MAIAESACDPTKIVFQASTVAPFKTGMSDYLRVFRDFPDIHSADSNFTGHSVLDSKHHNPVNRQ